MKNLVATIAGLVIAAFANPATSYVIQVTTSIPVTSAADDTRLKRALDSAIDDVLEHAIAFTPTVLTVRDARVVGDRIYILLLVADGDGEETMNRLSVEEPGATGSPRETTPSATVY